MNLQSRIEQKLMQYRLLLSGIAVLMTAMFATTAGAAAMSNGNSHDNYNRNSDYSHSQNYKSDCPRHYVKPVKVYFNDCHHNYCCHHWKCEHNSW